MEVFLIVFILSEFPLVLYAYNLDHVSTLSIPIYMWVIAGSIIFNTWMIWIAYPNRKKYLLFQMMILSTLISFLLIGYWLIKTPGL